VAGGYAEGHAVLDDERRFRYLTPPVVETVGFCDGQVTLAAYAIHDSRSCISHDLVIGHIVQDEEP
jgi:hypothetical protein